MKKKNLLIICMGIFTLFSCKKEYVCTCTQITTTPGYSHNGQNYAEKIDVDIPLQFSYKANKDEYESVCEKNSNFNTYTSPNSQYGQGPTTVVTTCEPYLLN